MVAFLDPHWETHGVEPICAALPIAPSTYYEAKARHADPTRRPARAQRDVTLRAAMQRVWQQQRQYLSIRYTERLAEAGIEPSVGSRGDSYDNALAETVIGLFKTELIRRDGPWRGLDDVEYATLEWVAWFNTERLLEPLGYVPPAEYEEQFHRAQTAQAAGGVLT